MNTTDHCSNQEPYRCPSFTIGGFSPGLTLSKANQLASSLEDEELVERLKKGPQKRNPLA
jgi:hypothetical protein